MCIVPREYILHIYTALSALSSVRSYNFFFYCNCLLFFEERGPAKLIFLEVESAQVEPSWRGALICVTVSSYDRCRKSWMSRFIVGFKWLCFVYSCLQDEVLQIMLCILGGKSGRRSEESAGVKDWWLAWSHLETSWQNHKRNADPMRCSLCLI